ncbi:hypothetical protein JTB14_017925 [Gonioctena quinquepunctata]|nr:hypothetical protein JTB14_017925 [Gonioctena quinquepunctata]
MADKENIKAILSPENSPPAKKLKGQSQAYPPPEVRSNPSPTRADGRYPNHAEENLERETSKPRSQVPTVPPQVKTTEHTTTPLPPNIPREGQDTPSLPPLIIVQGEEALNIEDDSGETSSLPPLTNERSEAPNNEEHSEDTSLDTTNASNWSEQYVDNNQSYKYSESHICQMPIKKGVENKSGEVENLVNVRSALEENLSYSSDSVNVKKPTLRIGGR